MDCSGISFLGAVMIVLGDGSGRRVQQPATFGELLDVLRLRFDEQERFVAVMHHELDEWGRRLDAAHRRTMSTGMIESDGDLSNEARDSFPGNRNPGFRPNM